MRVKVTVEYKSLREERHVGVTKVYNKRRSFSSIYSVWWCRNSKQNCDTFLFVDRILVFNPFSM